MDYVFLVYHTPGSGHGTTSVHIDPYRADLGQHKSVNIYIPSIRSKGT